MIRLIASDLDGTLLNQEGEISLRNKKAIQEAVDLGIRFILATGRMAVASRRYARELGLDVPIITYQGALVETLGGEILYRKVVPIQLATEIVELVRERGIHIQIFLKDRVYAQQINGYAEAYGKKSSLQVEAGDLTRILAKEPEGLEKILCIGPDEVLQLLGQDLRARYENQLHFTSSNPLFLDMVHIDVNKGNALRALADGWKISSEEVMALGDNMNDREMLFYAGMGVAMENAHPELKTLAKHITAPYWEDGVAQAIEKFVLEKHRKDSVPDQSSRSPIKREEG